MNLLRAVFVFLLFVSVYLIVIPVSASEFEGYDLKEKQLPEGSYYFKLQGYKFNDVRVYAVLNGQVVLDFTTPDEKNENYAKEYYSSVTKYVKKGKNVLEVTIAKSNLTQYSANGYSIIMGNILNGKPRTVFSFAGFGDNLKLLKNVEKLSCVFDTDFPKVNMSGKGEFLFKMTNYAVPFIQLNLVINGKRVGTYYKDADVDVSPFVIPGKNDLRYTIERLRPKERTKSYLSTATLGEQRGGNYHTLASYQAFSEDIDRLPAKKNIDYSFNVAGGEAQNKQNPGISSQNAKQVSLKYSGSPNNNYSMSINHYAPVNLKVEMNGRIIGTYSGPADADVTKYARSGYNEVKLTIDKISHCTNSERIEFKIFKKTGSRFESVVKANFYGDQLNKFNDKKVLKYEFTD